MTDADLQRLMARPGVAPWRVALARLVESKQIQTFIIAVIVINALVLGMEATPLRDTAAMPWLHLIDQICLGIFIIELLAKALAYRFSMLRSGWNVFDILVVGIALVPAAGPASVLRGLRVLRVFRLLTAVPALKRVILAFIHAIPGLASVVGLMVVIFYIAAVMATGLFGEVKPEFFGHLGRSLFTLFQVMTLESWSMGVVRPVMEAQPMAWLFFVPFILIATFTVLNLFIGVIVSTMNELRMVPAQAPPPAMELIERLEADLAELRRRVQADQR